MIGSGDDVDRTALNPNRVDQPFDEIGGGLTKAQIVERLKAIRCFYWAEDGMYEGDDDDKWADATDIDTIIKEAENG